MGQVLGIAILSVGTKEADINIGVASLMIFLRPHAHPGSWWGKIIKFRVPESWDSLIAVREGIVDFLSGSKGEKDGSVAGMDWGAEND
jgi:hypothetical protein